MTFLIVFAIINYPLAWFAITLIVIVESIQGRSWMIAAIKSPMTWGFIIFGSMFLVIHPCYENLQRSGGLRNVLNDWWNR